MIAQMFTGFHFEHACTALALRQLNSVFLIVLVIALVGAHPVKEAIEARLAVASPRVVAVVECASYAFALVLLVVCILSLSGSGYNPFIYFRF